MRHALRRILFVIVLLGAAAAGGAVVSRAQPQSQSAPPDVLNALLIEVRGLRAAMEQLAGAGPRVQLVFGRLQLQEQRITELSRRLDMTRGNLAASRERADQWRRQIKGVEDGSLLRDVDNPDERKMIEERTKAMKAELGDMEPVIQRLAGEEAALLQDIAAEQSRWTDFNQRLEELERSLRR